MKPFLLLATRAQDAAADEEYAAFVRFCGLESHQLVRARLEQAPLSDLELGSLEDYSGLLLGGSPFTISAPAEHKSGAEQRAESEILTLLDEVVARDLPFFGACYGIGTLGVHQGGVVDGTYSEPVGAVKVELTEEGQRDPLFGVLPPTFEAFVGHKEAIRTAPSSAVSLASSAACPVQAFRVRRNVYATQFHPELDVPGIKTRIDVYRHAGYFSPDTAEEIKRDADLSSVVHPPLLLRRFVELYAR